MYAYNNRGKPVLHPYGELYANHDFSKVTMAEFRKEINGGRGWSGDNGWMMTGPANDKSKALEITNELMKNVLKEKLK